MYVEVNHTFLSSCVYSKFWIIKKFFSRKRKTLLLPSIAVRVKNTLYMASKPLLGLAHTYCPRQLRQEGGTVITSPNSWKNDSKLVTLQNKLSALKTSFWLLTVCWFGLNKSLLIASRGTRGSWFLSFCCQFSLHTSPSPPSSSLPSSPIPPLK